MRQVALLVRFDHCFTVASTPEFDVSGSDGQVFRRCYVDVSGQSLQRCQFSSSSDVVDEATEFGSRPRVVLQTATINNKWD